MFRLSQCLLASDSLWTSPTKVKLMRMISATDSNHAISTSDLKASYRFAQEMRSQSLQRGFRNAGIGIGMNVALVHGLDYPAISFVMVGIAAASGISFFDYITYRIARNNVTILDAELRARDVIPSITKGV